MINYLDKNAAYGNVGSINKSGLRLFEAKNPLNLRTPFLEDVIMKKLLICGLLATGTLSALAGECRIHVDYVVPGSYHEITKSSHVKLASKIAREIKKSQVSVVKNAKDANVGLKLFYSLSPLTQSYVDNGPYPRTIHRTYKKVVNVLVYNDGRAKELLEYDAKELSDVAESLLKDVDCK